GYKYGNGGNNQQNRRKHFHLSYPRSFSCVTPVRTYKNYDKKRQIAQPKVKENPPQVNAERFFQPVSFCKILWFNTKCIKLFKFISVSRKFREDL
ncbi:hypothetical protein P9759_14305, partial [Heyndrickxia coagulans]|uniref:hypothetical protein n=1 Tax=Heyndrickxia coagulans TaxID=1398 RepID=UPI002E1A3C25|nr:hypothetical protein [Heyndrickxia coagulans]